MGPKEQDLIEDHIMILRTSSVEQDRKDMNDDLALLMSGGGGRPAAVSKGAFSIVRAEKISESAGTHDIT